MKGAEQNLKIRRIRQSQQNKQIEKQMLQKNDYKNQKKDFSNNFSLIPKRHQKLKKNKLLD